MSITLAELHRDDSLEAQKRKNLGKELTDWEEHVKTLDKDITELQIEPNKYKFKDDKLVIKDFPDLTLLYACGLGLDEVELDLPTTWKSLLNW